MNAPHPLQQLTAPEHIQAKMEEDDEINLAEYWDIIVDARWLIAAAVAIAFCIGAAYAFLARPTYETNLLIQVEDQSPGKGLLGDAASLFDVKTAATAEIEILRSRMVLGQAVDNTLFFVDAKPRYLPLLGNWLAQKAKGLSDPGVFGLGGWVSGTEKIDVAAFEVPDVYLARPFRLTALASGKFALSHSDLDTEITGSVGELLKANTVHGELKLLVSQLQGKQGAQFEIVRFARLETIESLQENLKLAEKGRQSGVIEATLQDTDRTRLTTILNEIGKQYVRQNVERKAAEAQKTLAFLDVQLPQFKKQLDQSEEAYNRYRNEKGTVALDEEAKLILSRSVDLQGKLAEVQQKRLEVISRFTSEHPAVKTLDAQIASWTGEINALNARVKRLPLIQQDALRLERDVKVNNELYQQLRNSALQLQLMREGKIGNVRLIDSASTPIDPVKPRRLLTVVLSLFAGLLGGMIFAIVRSAVFSGIGNAQEIETNLGLNVYSTIPLSEAHSAIARRVESKAPGIHLLAHSAPEDLSVESLRSLRTALQFAMLDAPNNRILISGPTPGIGKSFIAANLAAVVANGGKRVLLIDADLRKGHLNQYFGLDRTGGLSEVVTGSVALKDALRTNLAPNLDFLPTGVLPPNPAELLLSSNFSSVLDELSHDYDLVVIDSAPVLVAADTLSVSLHAGTVLLVARAHKTQLGELNESARRLAHVGISVKGVLFNGIDLTRRHYGKYAYKYGGYKYQQYNYGRSD